MAFQQNSISIAPLLDRPPNIKSNNNLRQSHSVKARSVQSTRGLNQPTPLGTSIQMRQTEGGRFPMLNGGTKTGVGFLAGQQQAARKLNYGTINSEGENFSMKSHLQSLENKLGDIIQELQYHSKQVEIINSEKDTLNSVLSMKIEDVQKTVKNEEHRIQEEMKRNAYKQQTESERLNIQVKQLKVGSHSIGQQLLGLHRRITDMEQRIGITDDS